MVVWRLQVGDQLWRFGSVSAAADRGSTLQAVAAELQVSYLLPGPGLECSEGGLVDRDGGASASATSCYSSSFGREALPPDFIAPSM